MSAVARLLTADGLSVQSIPTEDGEGYQLAVVLDQVYAADDDQLGADDAVQGLAQLLGDAIAADLADPVIQVDAERVDLPRPTPERNPR